MNAHLAVLDVIEDGCRPLLADASRLTEELRRYDSSYHAELSWWTTQLESVQGIPPSALVSETEAAQLDVSRHFPTGGKDAHRAEIGHDHSRILVLSTYDDSRPCALGAGEMLSTVLLECTMAGLATCTLTHMIEVTSAREIVRRLTGKHGMPQVLIRVGKAPENETPPPPTPRRPLTDVLELRQYDSATLRCSQPAVREQMPKRACGLQSGLKALKSWGGRCRAASSAPARVVNDQGLLARTGGTNGPAEQTAG